MIPVHIMPRQPKGSLKLVSFLPVILIFLAVFLVAQAGASGITVVTSGPQTIVKGDNVLLSGTGAMNGSMTLWIVGRDYFSTKTTTPDKKGNFSFTIGPEETTQFSTGEYAFLLQDPGSDRSFEIGPLLWSDGIRIADQGKVVFNIGQIPSFPSDISPVVTAIINASTRQDTDDIFTTTYFYVEDPSVRFNRISDSGSLPDQVTGEALLITGTTNIMAGDVLHVEIKNETSGEAMTSRDIPVDAGQNSNQWSYSLEEPGLPPGSYIVTVSEQKYTTSETASANLKILEYRIAGNSSLPLQPELPPGFTTYGVILPLLISCAALAIIGIIMLVSLRK